MNYPPMDLWSWAAMLLLPVWIAAGYLLVTKGFARLVGRSWWGSAAAFSLGVCAILGGAAAPATMMTRFFERQMVYESCVTYGNARDPLNGCPQWTIRALS